MSLSVAVIDALLATGATREQIAAAIKADIAVREGEEAAKLEAKREGNRRRQARKRERDSNAESRVTAVTAVTARDARDTPPKVPPKEINQTPSSPPVEASEPNGSSPQPRPWSLPVGVSLQVWTDFLGNRKRKRLGTTPTAWKAFNDDLRRVSSQTGIPPPQLIEQCTAKGWGAIYDPTDQRDQRHERVGNPTGTAVERILGNC